MICEYPLCSRKAKGKFDDEGILKWYCLMHGQGKRTVKDHEVVTE